MRVNLFCFVELQIFVWTYIPNYLSRDSDCEIPEARPDADAVQPIQGHFFFLFAELFYHHISFFFLERV